MKELVKSQKLYLASQSPIRKQLLEEADIKFTVISQVADETACDWSQPIDQLVLAIAKSKLKYAQVPVGAEGDVCYVLTADTLVQNEAGELYGKPIDRDSAIKTLRELRDGIRVVTGFCCAKKVWSGGAWEVESIVQQTIGTAVVVDIPDTWISVYLDKHPCALQTAGVLFVEGYGAQFVKTVTGSYTAVLGLPMYEVRQALATLGFFDDRFGE